MEKKSINQSIIQLINSWMYISGETIIIRKLEISFNGMCFMNQSMHKENRMRQQLG